MYGNVKKCDLTKADIEMKETAIIGGLENHASIEDAWQLLSNQLWWLQGPQPAYTAGATSRALPVRTSMDTCTVGLKQKFLSH